MGKKKSAHDVLYEAVLEAIRKLYAETSLSQQETAASLISIRDEINMLLDSL